jgi:hypothetical protein
VHAFPSSHCQAAVQQFATAVLMQVPDWTLQTSVVHAFASSQSASTLQHVGTDMPTHMLFTHATEVQRAVGPQSAPVKQQPAIGSCTHVPAWQRSVVHAF